MPPRAHAKGAQCSQPTRCGPERPRRWVCKGPPGAVRPGPAGLRAPRPPGAPRLGRCSPPGPPGPAPPPRSPPAIAAPHHPRPGPPPAACCPRPARPPTDRVVVGVPQADGVREEAAAEVERHALHVADGPHPAPGPAPQPQTRREDGVT